DLNLAIDPGSGWILQTAAAINDDGLIVGTGTLNGVSRAFLLRPGLSGPPVDGSSGTGGAGSGGSPGGQPPHTTPEPGTLVLALLGAAGVGSWASARRRRARPRGPGRCARPGGEVGGAGDS